MLKLIKLELKKNKFNGSWLGILIANLCIMGLVALMYFDPETLENELVFIDFADAFSAIDTFVRATFIIYASVLIAKFVIEEYKNKTMSLMFSYPISRKKLIAAKLTIIFTWTFLTITLSNVVISGVLVLVNNYFGYIPGTLEMDTVINYVLKMLLNTVSAAGLSLIPLFFGMWKKSVPGTIVSAVLIVSIFSSSSGGFSLYSIIAVPIILAAIGILVAYLSIRNVDKVDLI